MNGYAPEYVRGQQGGVHIRQPRHGRPGDDDVQPEVGRPEVAGHLSGRKRRDQTPDRPRHRSGPEGLVLQPHAEGRLPSSEALPSGRVGGHIQESPRPVVNQKYAEDVFLLRVKKFPERKVECLRDRQFPVQQIPQDHRDDKASVHPDHADKLHHRPFVRNQPVVFLRLRTEGEPAARPDHAVGRPDNRGELTIPPRDKTSKKMKQDCIFIRRNAMNNFEFLRMNTTS